MSSLGNSPSQVTVLRVEARKSFSLGVRISDPRGRAVDLTDSTLTIVAKRYPIATDSDEANILAPNAEAILEEPGDGYARFDLQASTLDHPAGEYPFAIVLRTAQGYSSVIVKGVLDLQENTEVASVGTSYAQGTAGMVLDVLLREQNRVIVRIGSQLPPGMNYVRDETVELLENFDPDSIALVPTGGTSGYVLTKIGNGDYVMDWRPPGQGFEGLDATGQPAGSVPVALGDDTWTWESVSIDATGVPAGQAPIADGAGGWAWGDVSQDQPDWVAEEEEPGHILNKPELGTAALSDNEDFVPASAAFIDLPGVHVQTTIPSSGEEGHIYFVYQE